LPPPAVALPQRAVPTVPEPLPLEAVEGTPAADKGTLSLEQLITQAAQQNPDLSVARARAEAARGRLIQAGLYPNPTLTWEAEDVGAKANAAGNEGPIIAQQVMTGGKLRLAKEAAAQGVVAADWQAITRWFDVVTRVRIAYYEVLTAQQAVEANRQVVRLAEEGLAVAQKLLKGGPAPSPTCCVLKSSWNRTASNSASHSSAWKPPGGSWPWRSAPPRCRPPHWRAAWTGPRSPLTSGSRSSRPC
jgi:cobalt-zinc-cadmium efflux system outer membrane protein